MLTGHLAQRMRYARLIVLLFALLGLLLPACVQAAAARRHGVVIQVSNDDPESWDFTLTNIRYIQKQLGNHQMPIEVVAFGPGVYMLARDSEVRTDLHKAMEQGVRFVAGETSMRARGLSPKNMYPGIRFVPLGIAEIIRRQRAGWSYLKP